MTKDTIKMIHKTSDKGYTDINREYIRQLEDGLLKLKIENAYLKELRRLRLEGETLLKRKRESYTTSE